MQWTQVIVAVTAAAAIATFFLFPDETKNVRPAHTDSDGAGRSSPRRGKKKKITASSLRKKPPVEQIQHLIEENLLEKNRKVTINAIGVLWSSFEQATSGHWLDNGLELLECLMTTHEVFIIVPGCVDDDSENEIRRVFSKAGLESKRVLFCKNEKSVVHIARFLEPDVHVEDEAKIGEPLRKNINKCFPWNSQSSSVQDLIDDIICGSGVSN